MARAKLRQSVVIPDILVIHSCDRLQDEHRTSGFCATEILRGQNARRHKTPTPTPRIILRGGGAGAGYLPDNPQLIRFRHPALGAEGPQFKSGRPDQSLMVDPHPEAVVYQREGC